jgi:hypothetical protein
MTAERKTVAVPSGVEVLQNPFRKAALARAVRDALDAR